MTEEKARDPRIDRAMSWGLATLTVLALGVGGFFAKDASAEQKATRNELKSEIQLLGENLGGDLKKVRVELGDVRVDVAKLQEDRKRFTEVLDEQRELRMRLRGVEAALSELRAKRRAE